MIENSSEFKENRIFYSNFFKKTESLNEISIYIVKSNKNPIYFTLNLLIDDDDIESSSTQFIPTSPNNQIDFTIEELNYFFSPKKVECSTHFNEPQSLNQTLFCPSFCLYSTNLTNTPSICELALKKNYLPKIGGLIHFSQKGSISYLDNYHLGLNYLITDLKLGYYEDLKKNFFSVDNLNSKNFIFKLNNYKEYSERSFLFYKKQYALMNEFAISDVKLVCDNTKVINPFQEESNESVKIDKLHDMVNGFTLWIKKIRVSEIVRTGSYIEDVNIRFFDSNFSDKQSVLEIEFNHYLYTLDSNKFVCKINKNIILLEVKKTLLQSKSNYSDFDSSCTDTFQSLNLHYKKFHTNQV